MSRRSGRRPGRSATRPFYVDPFARLGFTRAWRAADAIDDGSVTTSLPNYLGAALPLLRQGTGQAIKATSANFGGKHSITVNGNDAAGGYSAVAEAGAPSALTFIWVGRLTATPGGLAAITAGGVVHSGEAQILNTTLRSSNQNTHEAASAFSLPGTAILVSVFTGAAVLHYATRYTPVTVASALALAGTTYHVMCRASNASVPSTMAGEWVASGYATRALSASEVAFALRMLGREYKVAIAA